MDPFLISTIGWYWFVKMQGHIFDFTSLYKGLKKGLVQVNFIYGHGFTNGEGLKNFIGMHGSFPN